tara:strand:- start:4449 stop:5495 length:1047 start_codon:yes stop_codon:yes gene_type:complete
MPDLDPKGSRWPELLEMTRHRVLAFVRQPEAVFWVFAFPVVLAAVLGFAFQSGDPKPSLVAVIADALPADTTALLDQMDHLDVKTYATRDEAENGLRGGKVDAWLTAVNPTEVRLDPVRPDSELARLRLLVALSEMPTEVLTVDPVEEKGSRYIDFLFPGLLGMNLMGTGLWSIGFGVAEHRQRKILKRLLVTPMRKSSFLLSFLMSRMVFLVGEVLALSAFAVWVLDVPIRASLFQFGLLCVIGAVGFAGLGLLTASRVKTIEGVSGMMNFVMMPMWLGSGVFFSYERFPEFLHPVLRLLPLTALNDALRATMLDGAPLTQLWPELAVLLVWTVLPFWLALKIFRWQ